jgi:hypothetical protein
MDFEDLGVEAKINFEEFKTFKQFNRYAPFKPPPPFDVAQGFLSRVAGEDEGGGLNDLNEQS